MKPTPSAGWIADEPIPHIVHGNQTYEVLLAGGKTCLATFLQGSTYEVPGVATEEVPDPPAVTVAAPWWHVDGPDLAPSDQIRETVYAWRFPLGDWFNCPAADSPWFPIATATNLRAGVVVEVLCHDGSYGKAFRQLADPADADSELVWEWVDLDESTPDPCFWRFHIPSTDHQHGRFLDTFSLHPTIRKHNAFLGDFLRPPVTFTVPEVVPGNLCPQPVVPSLLEGTSPHVELLELWCVLNDLCRYASDPARTSWQLYALEHTLGGTFRAHRESIEGLLRAAQREGR